MRQSVISLAAGGVMMAFMALITASWDVAGFALYVTIWS
jgi:hypothetical protein